MHVHFHAQDLSAAYSAADTVLHMKMCMHLLVTMKLGICCRGTGLLAQSLQQSPCFMVCLADCWTSTQLLKVGTSSHLLGAVCSVQQSTIQALPFLTLQFQGHPDSWESLHRAVMTDWSFAPVSSLSGQKLPRNQVCVPETAAKKW